MYTEESENIIKNLENKIQKKYDVLCERIDKRLNNEYELTTIYLSFLMNYWYGDEKRPHYTIDYRNCVWDYSGELKENGKIDFEESLEDFFEEHTGRKTPTFASHYGWNYTTIDDDLGDYTRQIASDAIDSIIMEFLNNILGEDDAEKYYYYDIRDDVWDDFYDNTRASDYFTAVGILRETDLKGVKASDFLAKSSGFIDWFHELTKDIPKEEIMKIDITEYRNFCKYYNAFINETKPKGNENNA